MQTTNNNSSTPTPDYSSIFIGVDFLLKHLAKPEFPRTIATKLTEGRQIVVANKEGALSYYQASNFMDCRLAAYPYTGNKDPQIIDFVMIDLDLNNFKFSRKKLDQALNKILLKLTKDLVEPTVIWSGNGYHILVPIDPLESILEDPPEFSRFKEPSKNILRFLEKHVSNGKSDSVHNRTVSFGNCMLRVPGSLNSKHNNSNKHVRVIKEWNNQKLSIKSLLGDFLAYLLDDENKKPHSSSYYKYNKLFSRP
jgi:hypothetical protein